ncbi:HAMP domain-containing sensor histidine kinase [Paenibacillus sp. BK720]|uniref:sensor histidine kinase n=1 Tax=Paenibacillus sp. BK720 TaxID=2587092 RepID=UPI00141D922B|nr:HAMP domain-containing sensor histidine kinase [Paenibacillus sp. BK720]NIK67434.1 signal transduction histidine kinase [Paenibacillus sp. BK720]
MSIRVKLYMSYLAMVFLPMVLILGFVVFVLYAGGMQDLREYFRVEKEEKTNQSLIYGELKYVLENDTDKLSSPAYTDKLQRRLADQWAGLIMAKDGIVTEVPVFLKELSPHEDWQGLFDKSPNTVSFKAFKFQINEIAFRYPDGHNGQMLLLRRYDVVPPLWRPIGTLIFIAFIGLSSLILTYYVSRSIIRPIHALKTAALQIKDGDLSQKVVVRSKGEVGQLAAAFEAMRIQLKESIDQSLQYEENRKQLLSHISHDLKTPISAIKGYVEGIMDGIANTDEKRQRYMETIYHKANDMDQLIDELFLFSKLDLHKVAFDFKTIDSVKYLEHYLEEQRFDLEKSGVKLSFQSPPGVQLLIAADPDKLGRVLTNILNNSEKYMGQLPESAEKRVTVSVREKGSDVLVAIEDTGPGIEKEDLPYIFDRFYRAEQSRNSETGGSGLGLAIVKQIIEGHGGTVWAENVEGGGARFCFQLPRAEPVRTVVIEHEEHSNH